MLGLWPLLAAIWLGLKEVPDPQRQLVVPTWGGVCPGRQEIGRPLRACLCWVNRRARVGELLGRGLCPRGPAEPHACLLRLGPAGQVWAGGNQSCRQEEEVGGQAGPGGGPLPLPPASQLPSAPRRAAAAALGTAWLCTLPAAGQPGLTFPPEGVSHGHPEAELHLWSLWRVSGPQRPGRVGGASSWPCLCGGRGASLGAVPSLRCTAPFLCRHPHCSLGRQHPLCPSLQGPLCGWK